MVATSPNSDSKMADNLPDINVAAEFYARYDIREVLGKYVCSSVRFIGDFFTLIPCRNSQQNIRLYFKGNPH